MQLFNEIIINTFAKHHEHEVHVLLLLSTKFIKLVGMNLLADPPLAHGPYVWYPRQTEPSWVFQKECPISICTYRYQTPDCPDLCTSCCRIIMLDAELESVESILPYESHVSSWISGQQWRLHRQPSGWHGLQVGGDPRREDGFTVMCCMTNRFNHCMTMGVIETGEGWGSWHRYEWSTSKACKDSRGNGTVCVYKRKIDVCLYTQSP